MIFKAVVTWLVFLLIGVVHVHVRDDLVAPQIGESMALWVGLIVYSIAILGVAVVFIFQNEIEKNKDRIFLASTWVTLSLAYKVIINMLVWEKSPGVLMSEAASLSGLVFCLEVAVMAFSPWIAHLYLNHFDIVESKK